MGQQVLINASWYKPSPCEIDAGSRFSQFRVRSDNQSSTYDLGAAGVGVRSRQREITGAAFHELTAARNGAAPGQRVVGDVNSAASANQQQIAVDRGEVGRFACASHRSATNDDIAIHVAKIGVRW
jgi:hypothetical protein